MGVGEAGRTAETALAPLYGVGLPWCIPCTTHRCMVCTLEITHKESCVDPSKYHILLGYCLKGPHGQFGCLGGSGDLPCSHL